VLDQAILHARKSARDRAVQPTAPEAPDQIQEKLIDWGGLIHSFGFLAHDDFSSLDLPGL
jgi:hypothetical protein